MADMNDPNAAGHAPYRDANGVLNINHSTPGFAGAILDLLKALGGAAVPQLTERPGNVNGTISTMSGAQVPPQSLGAQFGPQQA